MNTDTTQNSAELSKTNQSHLQTIELTVLFFAQARDITGTNKLALSVASGCSIRALRSLILAKFPALTDLAQSSLLAVNHQYVEIDSQHVLAEGDEVAFIPPISGG